MALFKHFDEMCWPQPGIDMTELAWRIRHGVPSKEDLGVAASVMEAYSDLVLEKTSRQRAKIVAQLKQRG